MTVAIDIDGTWTLDPRLFRRLAFQFAESGWTVIIVTGCEQPADKLSRLRLQGFTIIVSGPLLKEAAARRAGYKVDVWIDDMPGMIQNCQILQGDMD